MTMGEGTAYAIACNGGAGGRWFHRNIAGKKPLRMQSCLDMLCFLYGFTAKGLA
jgi:hypothetical protein